MGDNNNNNNNNGNNANVQEYYDYSHYYDEQSFVVTSVQPGLNLLIGTLGYTFLCIIVGFLFKCRKKKWRKPKSHKEEKELERVKEEQMANVDMSAYMCAVDEVIENAFFDEKEKDEDGASIDSNDSSKAYEYLFGLETDKYAVPDKSIDKGNESDAVIGMNVNTNSKAKENSYELFKESKGRGNSNKSMNSSRSRSDNEHANRIKNMNMTSDSSKGSDVLIQISPKSSFVEVSPKLFRVRVTAPSKSISPDASHRRVSSNFFSRHKNISDRSNSRNTIKHYEKRTLRRFLFGKRRSGLKNLEKGFSDRVIHSPSDLEIELKETLRAVNDPGGLVESYEDYHQYMDPSEVDKRTDPELNCSRDSKVMKSDKTMNKSGEGDDTFAKEMNEIHKLSIPWTLSSFISYFSSIVVIALISNFMSIAEMICYSYVWFIIDSVYIISTAFYNSLYKHVNNSVASETEEGYFKAGKYIRISIIVNTIISIPISFAMIFGMGAVFRMYGFAEQMVHLSFGYTIVAVLHNFASYTSSFITLTTDIDGYADFNAKYAFINSLLDIGLSSSVIPLMRPTLVQLGLIHLGFEVLSTAFYYFLTWYRYGWFDLYKEGIMTPLTYDRKDKKALATLVKKAIPMCLDELNGKLEWMVLAYFASHLGSADSSSWILLSYIWGLIGVVPSCIGSAAEYRVSNQLSKGNILLAQQLSSRCMFLTGVTSLIGTGVFFLVRQPLIKLIAPEYHLADMLIDVVPYLVLCQPLISLSTTGAYLNRALAMYQRSSKIELLITILVTIPAAWISTFYFGWDICGLTAASFVGYATMGLVILAIYNNADWEKAVQKNRKIAGAVDSSKVNTSIDNKETPNFSVDCDTRALNGSNDSQKINKESTDAQGIFV